MWRKRTLGRYFRTAVGGAAVLLLAGVVAYAFSLRPGAGPVTGAPGAQTPGAAATATPRPATGGPYITEARAIEIGLEAANAIGEVNSARAPRATFMAAKDVVATVGITGSIATSSTREKWVVTIEGKFYEDSIPSYVDPKDIKGYRYLYAVLDATTGELDAWVLKEYTP
jgi:hypothetical protein